MLIECSTCEDIATMLLDDNNWVCVECYEAQQQPTMQEWYKELRTSYNADIRRGLQCK